jgi:hypothetical protein
VLGSELPELAHRVGECEAAIWSLWGEKRTRRMHGQNDVIDRERTTRSTSGVHARQLTFGTLRDAVLRIRQSKSSNPLIITMAAAVPAPNATTLSPPCCNTIAASPIGMMVAISMNQPRACADP